MIWLTLGLGVVLGVAFPAHAWTLIGSDILGWERSTLNFAVNAEDCPITETEFNDSLDRAIALWNSIPSAGLRLARTSSTTTVSEFRAGAAGDVPVILCDSDFGNTLGSTNTDVVPGAAVSFNASPAINYGGILLNAEEGAGASIETLSDVELDIMIAHEMGHVLGLGHSSDESSLMYFNISNKVELLLTEDDRDGLTFLYPVNEFQRHPFGCGAAHLPETDASNGVLSLFLILAFVGQNVWLGRRLWPRSRS